MDPDKNNLEENNIIRVCTRSLSPSGNDLLLTFNIAQYMISLEICLQRRLYHLLMSDQYVPKYNASGHVDMS